MLGQIGISILVLMLFVFAVNGIAGVIISVVFLTNKMYGHCAKSIIYLFLLGITTTFTALPFLKMHGSYSDTDRALIIAFCLINIALILLYFITRIKALISVGKEKTRGNSADVV
jgi:ABC-type Fe3+-siderophore transport system permease subunit